MDDGCAPRGDETAPEWRVDPADEAARRRGGWRVVVAVLAVLAMVVAAAGVSYLALGGGGGTTTVPGSGRDSSTPPGSGRDASAAGTMTVPVYYLGAVDGTPTGRLALFREFHRVTGTDPVVAAVSLMLTGRPDDPDYATRWPAGTRLLDVTRRGSTAQVDLSADAATGSPEARVAALSVAQLVYTVTGADPTVRNVALRIDGQVVPRLWGQVPTAEPLSRAPRIDVEAPIWLVSPPEGARVPDPVTVSGIASVYEAHVSWQVLAGGSVVRSGYVTAAEAGPARAPWSVTISLPSGSYQVRVFAASAEDGSVIAADSKNITVR